MRTKKLFAVLVVIIVIIIAVFFSACQSKSGHKNENEDVKSVKILTDKEALDTCFQEIAKFEILTNKSNKFTLARLEAQNCFYEYSANYLDSLSKTEEPVYAYKMVHICLLKADMPASKLNQFINNNGQFLTLQDMLALYEQNRFDIPPYIWTLGGNFVDYIPAMSFLDNPEKKKEFPRGQFLVFSNKVDHQYYKYKANYFAVAYWENVSAK